MKTIRTAKSPCRLAALLVAAASVVIAAPAHAATFTVVDSGDAGPGTLRQAIFDANATPGTDTIAFNLPGAAPFSVQPLSQLPDVTDPVLIDGTTQPGFAGTPVIELNGAFASGAANGLKILGGDSTVRGLAINGWTDPAGGFGVWLSGAGNNRIEGCYLGTDIAGTAAQENNAGVLITSSDNNLIGGTTPGTRNVISGNVGTGIQIDPGADNVIQGNFIGTDATGTTAVPNGQAGVFIWLAGGNLVGGASPAERNVISGNSLNGIEVFAVSGPPNVVEGNYIGTDVSGSMALPNQHGVNSSASSAQQIGGTATGAGNLVSGNISTGVAINAGVVEGNFIGTDHTGTAALGNGNGVSLGAGVRVGGNIAAARNLISGNLASGVAMFGGGSFGNVVQGNFIGTDVTGTLAIGNFIGVSAQQNPAGNAIGGAGPGEGNLISGNQTGVDIRSPDNVVQGNLIGTDLTGTLALGNVLGVALYSPSANNLIGGSTPGARNVISGNSHRGVQLQGADGNRILGNLIGTDIAGGLPLGNREGVVLVDSSHNQVGGVNSGEGNIIAHSATDGVIVWNLGAPGVTVGNAIRGNAIHSNGGLGIDLGNNGPTANDSLDADTGANQLQNFPVLASHASAGASTTVQGTLHSTPDTSFALDFFASASPGAGANTQAERFLGSAAAITDSSGNANFSVVLPAATAAGEWITATATDADGNTSELSVSEPVQAPPPAAFNFAPAGPEFQVHTQIVGAQQRPDVAMDANGNSVVVWGSATYSLATSGVFAQRFDSDGNPVGGEFKVNGTGGSKVSVAMAPDGRFVIAWDEGHEIVAKRYDANGNPLPPPAGVLTGSTWGIGNEFIVKTGPPFGNTLPFGGGVSRHRAEVAVDHDGNFIIAWEDKTGADGSDWGVFAKRYDAAGNELVPPTGVPAGSENEFRVNSYTPGLQLVPGAAMASDGGFIITWFSLGQHGGLGGVFAKRYDKEGAELVPPPAIQGSGIGNEFQVNTHDQAYQVGPSGDEVQHKAPVTIASDGSFVIAWTSAAAGAGSIGQDCASVGVFAKRYDPAGNELTPVPGTQGRGIGNEFQVNSRFEQYQGVPDLAMTADGHFVVSWYGYAGQPTGRVVAKAYASDGQVITPPEGSQGNGLCNEFEATIFTAEGFPAVAIAPSGSFIIVWDDWSGADGDFSGPGAPAGIFARRYVSVPGPTPISPLTNVPVLQCPADITVNTGGSGQAAVPDLRSEAVITGVCASCASITVTQNPTPGTLVGCGSHSVELTLTDTAGHTASCTTIFTVQGAPAEITDLTAPAAPLPLGSLAEVSVQLAVADGLLQTATFHWSDGSPDTVTTAEPDGSCMAQHVYASPGVYRVTVTAENACGDVDIAVHEFVVVYDPEGGFVTGGGWINSPAGAYAADPSLTGKANFGFVAKYQPGANVPSGNTEFQFKAGDLNFKSTSYDWLVVAGAKAKFKGRGTVNGAGDYAFQLTATDGQVNGGGGTDRFRIKIWDQSGGGVIYDNQPGDADTADATTALGGGSIVVHKP
ncbi:MAG: right-handed parallel beta-helix repeat-containing protein [Verrucomicrobiales bacterium]|nr:right-handed parallel beta-helix repeat-containing protein [Verrucomicrobiales bacterium]